MAHQVGPFVVETIALRGHTPDGTAYRIRELELLAVGDHLSAVEFPFASSTSDYRTTLASLIELLRNDPPAAVVPGHGPPLTADRRCRSRKPTSPISVRYGMRSPRVETTAHGHAQRHSRSRCPGRLPTILPECMRGTSTAQLAELLPS